MGRLLPQSQTSATLFMASRLQTSWCWQAVSHFGTSDQPCAAMKNVFHALICAHATACKTTCGISCSQDGGLHAYLASMILDAGQLSLCAVLQRGVSLLHCSSFPYPFSMAKKNFHEVGLDGGKYRKSLLWVKKRVCAHVKSGFMANLRA